jgi:hypothetical protein
MHTIAGGILESLTLHVTDVSVWELMRHSSGTWSYWLTAGQSYSGPIIANIAGAMMNMIIANIAEAIMSIINHSYYNVFKDGLRPTI